MLADVAAAGPTSLAVLDTALVARPVALLDVLDRPRAKTMAWVVEDRDKSAVIGGADPSEVWPRGPAQPGPRGAGRVRGEPGAPRRRADRVGGRAAAAGSG